MNLDTIIDFVENGDFNDVVNWIRTGPYEEVLQVFLHAQGQCYYHQPDFLSRLKDEDLPLFINYDWWNQTKQIYLNRLRG